MKARILVSVLTLIICIFAIKGLSTVNQIDKSYHTAYIQTESATSDIGLSFDWYGLTIVDTAVKYSNGIIDSTQATQTLTEGSKNNIDLLNSYYKNILPQEKDAAEFIRKQDVLARELTYELLLLISNNDKAGVNVKISDIYEVVDPMCNRINDVIEIKSQNVKKINTAVHKEIQKIKAFMIISFALCISLCVGLILKD